MFTDFSFIWRMGLLGIEWLKQLEKWSWIFAFPWEAALPIQELGARSLLVWQHQQWIRSPQHEPHQLFSLSSWQHQIRACHAANLPCICLVQVSEAQGCCRYQQGKPPLNLPCSRPTGLWISSGIDSMSLQLSSISTPCISVHINVHIQLFNKQN